MEERLVDLDELVLRCRNERAKAYIAEAVACYRAGAFRACIVTTWVAVVYDILHKLDELALAGDTNAETKRADFERHRQQMDIPNSLRFERNILAIAKDAFELISPIEHEDLQRLLADRNRCAHPSMNAEDEIYMPTAELARYHLRNAVTSLLQQQPVQGTAALERLKREITSLYFPIDPHAACAYFQQGPLRRPRAALVRNFIIVLLKALLNESLDESAILRYASAFNAVRMMYRSIADSTLTEDLSRILRTLADDMLPNAVVFLMHIPDVWESIAADVRTRIENFIAGLSIQSHASLVVWSLDFAPTQERAQQRIEQFTNAEVRSLITVKPSGALADRAVAIYAKSGSYNQANALAKEIIIPLIPTFTVKHITTLLEAVATNNEIYESMQLIDVLRHIVERRIVSQEYIDAMMIRCGRVNYTILIHLSEYVTETQLVAFAEASNRSSEVHEILTAMKEKQVITASTYKTLMIRFGLESELENEDIPS